MHYQELILTLSSITVTRKNERERESNEEKLGRCIPATRYPGKTMCSKTTKRYKQGTHAITWRRECIISDLMV